MSASTAVCAARRTVVVATRNAGKAAEFAHMLGGDRGGDADGGASSAPSVDWQDLSAYPEAGDVEETGDTFLANACLKAAEYARRTGQWTLSDDSGLEVDALDGKPGVTSARWAKLHAAGGDDAGSGDAANNALLLHQLRDVPADRRAARFVCVLALADRQGRVILTARGTAEGRIIRGPRGGNGFGYDPLFEITSARGGLQGHTMAELDAPAKAAVSHRGEALRRLAPDLRRVWETLA